jgi:Arc/MetJ family transcription regulator
LILQTLYLTTERIIVHIMARVALAELDS